MSEDDELARRFFALWAEYLAALAADPQAGDALHRWLRLAASFGDGAGAGSPPVAAAAAGASGEREPAVAELARRVDELDRRLAALERRRRAPAGARRRNPRARS